MHWTNLIPKQASKVEIPQKYPILICISKYNLRTPSLPWSATYEEISVIFLITMFFSRLFLSYNSFNLSQWCEGNICSSQNGWNLRRFTVSAFSSIISCWSSATLVSKCSNLSHLWFHQEQPEVHPSDPWVSLQNKPRHKVHLY